MNDIYTDILNIIYNDMKNEVDGKNSDTNDK